MLKRKKLSPRVLSSSSGAQIQNLFDNIPATLQQELFQTLAESCDVRIERIVSDGHTTPVGDWYDQEWDEWILLISGAATLQLENSSTPLTLSPGDHLMIPAGSRHRVEQTDTTQKTIWLAVHFGVTTTD